MQTFEQKASQVAYDLAHDDSDRRGDLALMLSHEANGQDALRLVSAANKINQQQGLSTNDKVSIAKNGDILIDNAPAELRTHINYSGQGYVIADEFVAPKGSFSGFEVPQPPAKYDADGHYVPEESTFMSNANYINAQLDMNNIDDLRVQRHVQDIDGGRRQMVNQFEDGSTVTVEGPRIDTNDSYASELGGIPPVKADKITVDSNGGRIEYDRAANGEVAKTTTDPQGVTSTDKVGRLDLDQMAHGFDNDRTQYSIDWLQADSKGPRYETVSDTNGFSDWMRRKGEDVGDAIQSLMHKPSVRSVSTSTSPSFPSDPAQEKAYDSSGGNLGNSAQTTINPGTFGF
ncbi:MAG TPA: hypothetical protein V6C81_07930 [Planktothrix sp.]